MHQPAKQLLSSGPVSAWGNQALILIAENQHEARDVRVGRALDASFAANNAHLTILSVRFALALYVRVPGQ
jgi:hypothetical protein